MSAIDDVIYYHSNQCTKGAACNLSQDARAELAALRASVATLTAERDAMAIAVKHATHNTEQITALMAQNEEQARQLSAAYRTAAKIAENCAINGYGNDRRYKVAMDISRQLLELDAPAPQAEQEQTSTRSGSDR